jgi:hypothetical protein
MQNLNIQPKDFRQGDVLAGTDETILGYIRLAKTPGGAKGIEYALAGTDGERTTRVFIEEGEFKVHRPELPVAIVFDTAGAGYTFDKDHHGKLFTLESARKFAADRNAELVFPTYRVLNVTTQEA